MGYIRQGQQQRGLGGERLRIGGSDEGDLEELVEFRLSRAWRSATHRSYSWIKAQIAAFAAGGICCQSSSGIGGSAFMQLDYRSS
jgi:hypothetical protein